MNNYVFMFIGFLGGFLFSAIISWLLMRKDMDDFEERIFKHLLTMAENGDRAIELIKKFDERDELYMDTTSKLCDICERQLDANKEYGRRVQELVSEDHTIKNELVNKLITKIGNLTNGFADHENIEDERWEILKDYILSDEEDGNICDSCMYGDTNPMEEPCYSCKFNINDIPTHFEEKTENDQ